MTIICAFDCHLTCLDGTIGAGLDFLLAPAELDTANVYSVAVLDQVRISRVTMSERAISIQSEDVGECDIIWVREVKLALANHEITVYLSIV